MDRTLIVCASYHGVALETQACMKALQKHGAMLLSATGVPDVALARNKVLTLALEQRLRLFPAGAPADVALLVDDDMVFTLEAAAKLVGLARQTGEPWSAAYATKDGHLAATPLEWDAHRKDGLRMVGLGMCAVPFAKLIAIAQKVETVIGPHDRRIVPFCECRVVTPEHDGLPRWCSEDYWLCRALGGVRIAPYVAAGHLKTVPLWPDDETLRLLANGEKLTDVAPGTPPADQPPPAAPPVTKPDSPQAKKKKGSKRNGSAQTRA